MYSISLPTAYGPAAYNFNLSTSGEVSEITCATLDLPPAVLKLTYPDTHPDDLRQHLESWLPVLPYLIELGIWLEQDTPDYLKPVQQAFRDRTDDYLNLKKAVAQADLLAEVETQQHWQRANAWIKMGVAKKVARFPLILNRKDTVFAAEKLSLPFRRLAAGWLLDTFPLAPPLRLDEWIIAIGKTRTTEGNDFLLRELEQPGYLPYAKQIYSTLANSRLKLPVERVLALYEDQDKVSHSVNAYIHLINQFPFPKVKSTLERIIAAYPQDSFGAVKRLYKHEPAAATELLKTRFLTVDHYGVAITMLRHMVKLVRPDDYFISLREINLRLQDPAFIDNAQVTWPQKLSDGWREVLLYTPPQEFQAVLEKHFADAQGRVARNMLLQLKEYLRTERVEDFRLPVKLEAPLLNLLHSRFDKVSTVATDVIRLLLPSLQQPKAAVWALLEHIEVSQYRMMDAAALKAAAEVPELRAVQEDYFVERLAQAKRKEDEEALFKILSYLRFLAPNVIKDKAIRWSPEDE